MIREASDMPPVPGGEEMVSEFEHRTCEEAERDILEDWKPDRIVALGLVMLAEKPHYFENHPGVPTMCGWSSCLMMRHSVHKFVSEVLRPFMAAADPNPDLLVALRAAMPVLEDSDRGGDVSGTFALALARNALASAPLDGTGIEGLTEPEAEILGLAGEVFSAFVRLPVEHPRERHEIAEAIHRVQDLIAARPTWRARGDSERPLRDPRYCGRCRIGERCSVPSCAGYRP